METTKEKAASGLFSKITSGKQRRPRRLLLYGVQGVGKSTFASMAPKPLFLPTEDGLGDIDCEAFPLLETYAAFKTALEELYQEEHDYETVVVDSLDWLEELIWKAVADEHGVKSIEDFGFGKGYIHALSYWRFVLAGLDALRKDRGMAVILLAHSKVERFESPDTESYDRYAPRIHKHAAAILQEWSDEVLFATYEVFTRTLKESFNKERTQGIGTGSRILRTSERPYCMAKNRLSLPAEIPLDWREYEKFLTQDGKER